MNKYKVPATMTTCLYLEVLAESEEEALAIAENESMASAFVQEKGFGSTDWRMGDPILLKEDIEGDEA